MSAIPDQEQFGDYGDWPGRDVLDPAGERLGGVVEIYLDDATDRPEWVLVEVAEGTPRFVPLAGATVQAEAIRVAQPAQRVEGAPAIDPRVELTQNQERELYSHYGLRYSEEESDSGLPAPGPETTTAERPAPRPRLRRYAGPETVAVGEPPPAPPADPKPLPPPYSPPPPHPAALRDRVQDVPQGVAAAAAAGILALLLLRRRRRRRR